MGIKEEGDVSNQDFNLRLKARILERFGSQFRFSRAVGMSEDRLSKIIRKRRVPSPKETEEMAKLLGASSGQLFR